MSAEADLWEGFEALDPQDITGPAWDEPIPIKARPALPTFPVHTLPAWLGNMVSGVAEETQTPVDLAGCLALAVIATAAGGRAKVCVRGHWREPVNIYTAIALDPGNRKSAVFDLMVRPLLAAEKTLIELSGPVRAEAETTRHLAKSAADKAAQKAAAAEPDKKDALTAEAISLAQAVEEMTVPAVPQLVADDVTPENVGTLLDQQGDASRACPPRASCSTSSPAATPASRTWACSSRATPETCSASTGRAAKPSTSTPPP